MKKLILIAMLLSGCGVKPTPNRLVTVIHPNDQNEIILLQANESFPGPYFSDGNYVVDKSATLTIPQSVMIMTNGSEALRVTLTIKGIQIYYQGQGGSLTKFDCTGCGQTIDVSPGDVINLVVQSGYASQNTSVEASLQGVLK